MQRFLDLPNAVTLLGLELGLAAALLAVDGRAAWAFLALVLAGVCDLLDGLVARRFASGRSEEAKRFGARLDSLVDACSFGAAPALLVHALIPGPLGFALPAVYLAAAVWRLAWFDTVGLSSEGATRYYTGLPTTFAALFLPLAGLFVLVGPEPQRWAVGTTAAVHALLMVSPLRVPKPGGKWYAVLLLVALGLIGVWGWIAATMHAHG